jgi:hypothetical protein
MRWEFDLPLARWLASRNPQERKAAYIALYRFGADGGQVLLALAEDESRRLRERRAWLVRLMHSHPLVTVCIVLLLPVLLPLSPLLSLYLSTARLRAVALALAGRDDLRATAPLLEVWRPTGFLGLPRQDTEVEKELVKLLSRFVDQQTLGLRETHKADIRRKMTRLFPLLPFVRTEFSETRADLIVTFLQMLIRSGDGRDRTVVERIARLSARTPNRAFVREVAEDCLAIPIPATTPLTAPPTMPTQSATVAQPMLLNNRRQ